MSGRSVAPVRVMVVEDNALMRAATLSRLRSEPDIEVVGEAEESSDALLRIEERAPDVVVLDLRLGGSTQEGLNLAAEVGRRFPKVRFVIYTAYFTKREKLDAPNIWGFVMKTDPPRSVVEAVRAVAKADRYRSAGWPTGPDTDASG